MRNHANLEVGNLIGRTLLQYGFVPTILRRREVELVKQVFISSVGTREDDNGNLQVPSAQWADS
ncbi:MAG: hypothetical protein ACTS4V_01425 [Candidatus Hodgkinia cicadicola]